MEYLFFVELIEWLTEKGADLGVFQTIINGEHIDIHNNKEIKKLFKMFKEERL